MRQLDVLTCRGYKSPTFERVHCDFNLTNILHAEVYQIARRVAAEAGAVPAHVSEPLTWETLQSFNEGRLEEVRVYLCLKARLAGFCVEDAEGIWSLLIPKGRWSMKV